MGSKNGRIPVVMASQAEVADAFDVSLSTVAYWRKSGMPGRAGAWPLRAICRWLRGPDGPWGHADEEMLSVGGNSPALERYRLARAEEAEIGVLERKKEIMSTERAREMLGRWGDRIRAAGVTLGRHHGAEAQATLTEALEDCGKILFESLGPSTSQGD